MSGYANAQHDRMLAGVVKDCYVVAVDLAASPPACRVSDGEWVSAWVRWHSLAAGKARHWRAPSIGEQGTLVSASGDMAQGTFIPGLYGDAGPPPDNRDHVEVWRFDDGGSLVYDWQAKAYSITLPTGTVALKVGSTEVVITDDAVTARVGSTEVVVTGDAVTAKVGGSKVELTPESATVKAMVIQLVGAVLIEGPLHVTQNINSDMSIIDTAGNSNHHKH